MCTTHRLAIPSAASIHVLPLPLPPDIVAQSGLRIESKQEQVVLVRLRDLIPLLDERTSSQENRDPVSLYSRVRERLNV